VQQAQRCPLLHTTWIDPALQLASAEKSPHTKVTKSRLLFAGQEEDVAYSLQYTAPEIMLALQQGATAADMWSMGVIAWELLTGEHVCLPGASFEIIANVLTGVTKLPWECEESAERLAPRLRVLRRSVLQCLSRDPSDRPTSRELLGAWNGMFESLTGTTRGQFAYVKKEAELAQTL
jgi:serine/threonine protein kinase